MSVELWANLISSLDVIVKSSMKPLFGGSLILVAVILANCHLSTAFKSMLIPIIKRITDSARPVTSPALRQAFAKIL